MQMTVSMVVDQNYLSRKRPFSTKQQCCICVCSRNCSNSTFRTNPCRGILSLSHCLLHSQRLFPGKYVDMRVHHRIPNHCIRKDCWACIARLTTVSSLSKCQISPLLRVVFANSPKSNPIGYACLMMVHYICNFGTERMKVLFYFGEEKFVQSVTFKNSSKKNGYERSLQSYLLQVLNA